MKQKGTKNKLTRSDFWKDQIRSWRSSDLSQSEYCRKNRLDINLFSKWKHRFSGINFVPIKSKPADFQKNEFSFELLINDKYKLKLMPDFSTDDLKKIMEVLRGEA